MEKNGLISRTVRDRIVIVTSPDACIRSLYLLSSLKRGVGRLTHNSYSTATGCIFDLGGQKESINDDVSPERWLREIQ